VTVKACITFHEHGARGFNVKTRVSGLLCIVNWLMTVQSF